jgi:hypothetical protein
MAKFKLPSIAFNEGSLFRRTLLHVVAFVMASSMFVAIASFLVVTAAKSLLPSRHAEADEASDSDNPAEVAAVTPTKPGGKVPRPRRGKAAAAAPAAEEAPAPAAAE